MSPLSLRSPPALPLGEPRHSLPPTMLVGSAPPSPEHSESPAPSEPERGKVSGFGLCLACDGHGGHGHWCHHWGPGDTAGPCPLLHIHGVPWGTSARAGPRASTAASSSLPHPAAVMPTVAPPSSQETSPGPLRSMGSLGVGDREAEREAPSLCSREWSALCAGPVCTPKALFDGKPASSPGLLLRRNCGSSLSPEQLAGEHVASSQASGQPRLTQNAGHPHGPQR